MPLIQVIVLGLVQGFAEFLPISSSAHLIVVSRIFHWPDQGLTFDVALHMGTLLAVVIYFFRTWLDILLRQQRLLGLLILGTIPGGIAGLLLEHFIEHKLRDTPAELYVIAGTAIGIALVMTWAENISRKARDLGSINGLDSVAIGCAQALAVIPGVSRSGVTISAALSRDFDRESSARYSFLLATPLIAGAGLKKAMELRHTGIPAEMKMPFLLGTAIAAVSGFLVIAFFLRYLQTKTLKIFIYYRIAFGIIVLLLAILSRPR